MIGRDDPTNEIYEDTIIKYTLNIPMQQYAKISKATTKRSKYGGRKSTFIREAIDEKLKRLYPNESPVTIRELLQREKEGKICEPERVYEPPHRFLGFIGGLLRSPFKLNWFRKKLESKIF